MTELNRRRVLRGMLNGGAVTVALPLLNVFLNGNGNAMADGKPMPVRFGTWFWGCGMNAKVFTPKTFGANWELPEEIACLKDVKKHLNLLSNFNAFKDTSPNLCHYTAWVTMRTGIAPESGDHRPGETYDITVSKKIGRTTRFQHLTATATGDVRTSFSYENANSPTAPEWSPVNFYTRLFGPDFQDPNAPTFTPNPKTMVRKSVLSGVMDQTSKLKGKVGAEDKARLDQYFSGLRDLERQFDQQLTKPDPIAACLPPKAAPEDTKIGGDTELVAHRHKLMTDLMVMAVACDQTRVFNMAYSAAQAATIKVGYEKPHHTTTHEEPLDERLGYQPIVSWFTQRSMESWAYYVDAFAKIKEGSGTLLDNCLIIGSTDQSLARIHALDNVPMFTAGRAGGKVKAGLHIDGGGSTVVRLGYTAMKIMGVDIGSWGTKSNTTSKEVGEILA